MPTAPQGTITFLFTDIVGSTKLWEKFPQAMGSGLARHDQLVRRHAEENGGYVFKTVGDSFCVAFESARDGLSAAVAAQLALAAEDWGELGRIIVRMGLHTGVAEYRENDYFGGTLNRAARIEAAAHGGQILMSQIAVELLEDEPLDGITFKSLGSHRLRNLDRPEQLFQAVAPGLADGFPPPKSLEVLPNNLPVQTTSFIGREKETEEIQRLLQVGRLLTLTGTGGTGKTRMALEVGARVINEFPDGVWFAEFAVISDAEQIPGVIAGVLGIREESERPLRETVLRTLHGKSLLLILDNCEHLQRDLATLTAEFLRSASRLKILATSRHSLGVSGETTFAIPPLGIFDVRLKTISGPDIVEKLLQFDAVRLFVERAQAVRPDFVLTAANAPAVAEICSRLDGIPLALELAAARVRVLSVAQIAERLDDRFRLLRSGSRDSLPHQQTLQALIDWSYDLLSESERILLRRLGVFVGGRSLEALEAVCSGEGVEEDEILDLLEQLVDKSLVMVERVAHGELRYTITESVWQYSREKLDNSGETKALRQRHMDYFLGWAEKAAPHLEGPDQKTWLDRTHSDMLNFRTALEWAIEEGQTEAGLRIISSLYRLVEIRGRLVEALELARQLLAAPTEGVPLSCRADACVAAERFSWALDQYAGARKYAEEAAMLYATDQNALGLGLTEMLRGFLDVGDQAIDEAEKRFQHGLEIACHANAVYLMAGCQSGLGSVAQARGNLEEARRLKEDSLVNYERIGDQWIVGLILWGISKVAMAQGDLPRVRTSLHQWTDISNELGNEWILPYILDGYSDLTLADGLPSHAVSLLATAEALRNRLGAQFSAIEEQEHRVLLERLHEALSPEAFQTAWEEGLLLSPLHALKSVSEKLEK